MGASVSDSLVQRLEYYGTAR